MGLAFNPHAGSVRVGGKKSPDRGPIGIIGVQNLEKLSQPVQTVLGRDSRIIRKARSTARHTSGGFSDKTVSKSSPPSKPQAATWVTPAWTAAAQASSISDSLLAGSRIAWIQI